MPNVMVLGGGAFGRCLDHESGDLMNDIGVLIKETQRDSLASSSGEDTEEKALAMNRDKGPKQ